MSKSDNRVVAVFSPAYCLIKDGRRLTHMNEECLREAIVQFKVLSGSYLVVSCAYDFWVQEAQIKKEIIRQAGIDECRILILTAVTDRLDEVRKLKKTVREAGVGRLVIVAEDRHIPSLRLLTKALLPGLDAQLVPVFCRQFERAQEPWLKSLRASHKTPWVLWNKLVDLLLPLVFRFRPRH